MQPTTSARSPCTPVVEARSSPEPLATRPQQRRSPCALRTAALCWLLLSASVCSTGAQLSERQPSGQVAKSAAIHLPPADSVDLRLGSSQQTAAALIANGLELELLAGVPSQESLSDSSLPLGLLGALQRALRHNLSPALQTARIQREQAYQKRARSRLLPRMEAVVERRRDEFNFEASAFARFRPDDPSAAPVLAFDLFDARLQARWRLFDRPSTLAWLATKRLATAAEALLEAQRSSLILLTGNLYYRVALLERRAASALHRLRLAEELHQLQRDRQAVGLSTPTEVMGAEVEVLDATAVHDLLSAELEKAKLRLARITGLPLGQTFHLLDTVRYTPMRSLSLDAATEVAKQQRADLRALRMEVEAARAHLGAARGERLPALELQADLGEIGPDFDRRRETYGAAALLSVPIYSGGAHSAQRAAARAALDDAALRYAAAEASVYYQVAEGLIDEALADEGVHTARRGSQLAERLVIEAEDRLSQGLASSVEVTQARLELSLAQDRELDAVLAHRTAKGAVARAMGLDEGQILEILRAETTEAAGESNAAMTLESLANDPP